MQARSTVSSSAVTSASTWSRFADPSTVLALLCFVATLLLLHVLDRPQGWFPASAIPRHAPTMVVSVKRRIWGSTTLQTIQCWVLSASVSLAFDLEEGIVDMPQMIPCRRDCQLHWLKTKQIQFLSLGWGNITSATKVLPVSLLDHWDVSTILG